MRTPRLQTTVIAPILLLLSALALRQTPAARAADPASRPADVFIKGPWLVHLPGIGGYLSVDRYMLTGLRQGGVPGQFKVYDWTDNDRGIDALHARRRNDGQAAIIAQMIVDRRKLDADDHITITSHSGGCGLAVWALEKLPADCFIDTLVLMAPALSPGYDLSSALKHVKGNCYVLSSPNDTLILSTGTRLFGTIDGIKSDAAGLDGFVMPKNADADQYKKLIAMPYKSEWSRYDNGGEHIGSMALPFAKAVLSPLLGGEAPTTQPDEHAAK